MCECVADDADRVATFVAIRPTITKPLTESQTVSGVAFVLAIAAAAANVAFVVLVILLLLAF